jgi:hypothetical protein
MRPQIASLFDGLDGVTYFFVSSGLFVLLTASLFFGLGLWIGSLTWGRFKRKFRLGQESIEDLKNELALLKRRTADLASRAAQHAPGRSPLAALVKSASPPQSPGPPTAAFTLWTLPDWNPQTVTNQPLHRSSAFCLWPMSKSAVDITHATGSMTMAAGGEAEPLLSRSRAPRSRS